MTLSIEAVSDWKFKKAVRASCDVRELAERIGLGRPGLYDRRRIWERMRRMHLEYGRRELDDPVPAWRLLLSWVVSAALYAWQLPQNLLGLYNARGGYPDRTFRGVGIYRTRSGEGMSLGSYVFVESGDTEAHLLRHEFGHCLQSILLGPLYLPVVFVPSYLWWRYYVRRCGDRPVREYYRFYTERWADRNVRIDRHL